ncbi:MAG: polyhydroxyalkanoate synthesis regulator DNA-binding domain-containing protein [Candidatus Marinimicrobia bacterium]|jgi:polyhydroxyalkanoate synthesis repressor PhaR|nr:polyhydroxyalkanoate synthesis regulator DNA-binding domain-containing protein [Candidatus Neomarinimicrobiota bacterium]
MDNSEPIRITKYSNRRIYDSTNSQHLTLDQLVELIKEGHDVEVIDSKSKEDLTQAVLMQILIEDKGSHLFSASFLHQLIRNREGVLGEFFSDFVPKMLDAYLETQDSFRKQMQTFTMPNQWVDTSQEMKVPIFNPFTAFNVSGQTPSKPETSEHNDTEHDEVHELKYRLSELEKRLNMKEPNN